MKYSFLTFFLIAIVYTNINCQNVINNDDFIILGIKEFENPIYIVINSKNQSAIIEYNDISKMNFEKLDSNNIVFEKQAYYYCLFLPRNFEDYLLPFCDSSMYSTIKNISDNYFSYRNELNNFENKTVSYSNEIYYYELKIKKYLVILVQLSAFMKSNKIDPNPFLKYYNAPNYNGLYIKMVFPIV